MTKFLEKVTSVIMGEQPPQCSLHEIRIEFIECKNTILDHIEKCRLSQGIVGIYSPLLGQGMFLTKIEDIYKLGADTLIELKPYHFKTGLQKIVTLSIKDIKAICPFNQLLD